MFTKRVLSLLTMMAAIAPLACQRTSDDSHLSAKPRTASLEALDVDFYRDVAGVVERRCVVCHGCYDAPCQLNLSALEGADRGASKAIVYDGARLLPSEPTRIFIDAADTSGWRQKGFFPVLPDPLHSPQPAGKESLFFQMLELKRHHPLPEGVLEGFQFGLGRGQVCATPEEFPAYAQAYPLWGMPYGLPALPDDEQDVLLRWLADGARGTERAPVAEAYHPYVESWESFLNGDSNRQRLVGRYLYEHLFLAHLYFDDLPPGEYFFLVRSRTPPGEPVDVVASRRPYDDPGVERVYYRLQRLRTTVIDKTHMPYALNEARRARWESLFFSDDAEPDALPGYEPKVASNPFETFKALPVRSRYRFLLDEARFSLMNFIKGPVCRGQVAVDVINDRFWIFFVDPENEFIAGLDEPLVREARLFRLPAEHESAASLTSWLTYARLQDELLEHKAEYLEDRFPHDGDIKIETIWNGADSNRNASLTVFRNFDNATVVTGMVGAPPKTAWVLDYTLLERIHYLLVAGFDVFGNVGHQLVSRMYMDFLRMEAEANFLLLLPSSARDRHIAHWYRDVEPHVRDYVSRKFVHYDHEPGIEYHTEDPKLELFDLVRTRLGGALDPRFTMDSTEEHLRHELERLTTLMGRPATLMPEVSILSVDEPDGTGTSLFTMLRNSAHSDVATIFGEDDRRLPDEDTLTVTKGVAAAYPNAFYRVDRESLAAFVDAIGALRDEEDYRVLVDRFGVRRTHPGFWKNSDRVHELFRRDAPIESGVLDLNRLENR